MLLLKLLPLLLRLLKLEQFRCRALTPGEIALCQRVFGQLIDYSRVSIMNHPYLPWQPAHILMAPQGYIHVRDPLYREDYSQAPLAFQAVLIHEMTHIYQHQQQINVLLKGALLQTAFYLSAGQYNPYRYQLIPGKPFFAYNIEQQGDIARDIFLNKMDNIILRPPA